MRELILAFLKYFYGALPQTPPGKFLPYTRIFKTGGLGELHPAGFGAGPNKSLGLAYAFW
jgi:hypothetical protein